jgi:2',3'-cyclic-nucleotide 2'-phosphodiesterase (5'-nucleotidase family)
LLGFGPNCEYTPLTLNHDQTVGGIARVATVIKTLRQKAPETTLVIDGGDVLMGTLFHTVAREESAELRLLQAIGYEAITLGNHEFDFRPQGRHVGVLSLLVKNGATTMTDYRSIAINDSVEADRDIQAIVESYEDVINQKILRPYGFSCNQTLAETNFNLTIKEDDSNLGNLVSDAIRWSIDRLDLSSDNRQLYKVGCNIFVGTFIKFVGNFTWGLLTIVPKDSLGKPIADLSTALVDADPYAPGIQ